MKVLRAENQPEVWVEEEDGIGEGLGSALYIVKVCRLVKSSTSASQVVDVKRPGILGVT